MPFEVDVEFIVAVERALGCALPASYRAAMMRSNGGEVSALDEAWWLYPIADASTSPRISRTANHVLRETEQARAWPGFPIEALAIASNGDGDQLVLLRDGADFGDAVFAWRHDTRETIQVVADFAELTSGETR